MGNEAREKTRAIATRATEILEADLRARGKVHDGPHGLFRAFAEVLLSDNQAWSRSMRQALEEAHNGE